MVTPWLDEVNNLTNWWHTLSIGCTVRSGGMCAGLSHIPNKLIHFCQAADGTHVQPGGETSVSNRTEGLCSVTSIILFFFLSSGRVKPSSDLLLTFSRAEDENRVGHDEQVKVKTQMKAPAFTAKHDASGGALAARRGGRRVQREVQKCIAWCVDRAYRPERHPQGLKSSQAICPLMVMSRLARFDYTLVTPPAWCYLHPLLWNPGSTMRGSFCRKLKHFLIEAVNKGKKKRKPSKMIGLSFCRCTWTIWLQLGFYNSNYSYLVTFRCFSMCSCRDPSASALSDPQILQLL